MAWICGYCKSELLWGGDHDLEDEFGPYTIVSNYTCPGCDAYVEIST
jgi:hypothetical protein